MDYYNADNEGHIMIKYVNESILGNRGVEIEKGKAFAQGLFLLYGITCDDDANGERYGGFGSTDTIKIPVVNWCGEEQVSFF